MAGLHVLTCSVCTCSAGNQGAYLNATGSFQSDSIPMKAMLSCCTDQNVCECFDMFCIKTNANSHDLYVVLEIKLLV
jgi:hypothetical protein